MAGIQIGSQPIGTKDCNIEKEYVSYFFFNILLLFIYRTSIYSFFFFYTIRVYEGALQHIKCAIVAVYRLVKLGAEYFVAVVVGKIDGVELMRAGSRPLRADE